MSGDMDYGRLPAEDEDHFHRLDAHLVATDALMTTLDDVQATIDAKAMMVAYGAAGYGKTMSVNSALRKIPPTTPTAWSCARGRPPATSATDCFTPWGCPGNRRPGRSNSTRS
ncbi:hypothetical protein ACIQXA_39095 [Streptomyces massasporeus]|uniref:hypothetical protein n=1 Tax=Streptomyces massasporeus TaxID=67324 RepID=UPI003802B343